MFDLNRLLPASIIFLQLLPHPGKIDGQSPPPSHAKWKATVDSLGRLPKVYFKNLAVE